MSDKKARENRDQSEFWIRYITNLKKMGIKENSMRWYALRAEEYIRAFPGRKLKTHTVKDIQEYLQIAGRKNGIKDWEYLQIIDAMQNFLTTTDVPVEERGYSAFASCS